jgi:hypothetical protein
MISRKGFIGSYVPFGVLYLFGDLPEPEASAPNKCLEALDWSKYFWYRVLGECDFSCQDATEVASSPTL